MEPGPTVGPRSTVLGRRMLRLLGDYTRGVDHCRVASGLSPLACLRTTKDHFRGSDDEKRQLSAEFKNSSHARNRHRAPLEKVSGHRYLNTCLRA